MTFEKTFEKINHQNEALKKFLYQFQDKKNIGILIKIIAKQLNDIEDTLEEMNYHRGIDKAIGRQLDILGIYKNVQRLGQSDEDYRKLIKNQIALDNANGTSQSVINSAKIILGGKEFIYSESYPARCEIFIISTNCNIYQYQSLKKAVPLGVSLGIRYTINDEPFGYSGSKYSMGFGTIYNKELGGGYASIIGEGT